MNFPSAFIIDTNSSSDAVRNESEQTRRQIWGATLEDTIPTIGGYAIETNTIHSTIPDNIAVKVLCVDAAPAKAHDYFSLKCTSPSYSLETTKAQLVKHCKEATANCELMIYGGVHMESKEWLDYFVHGKIHQANPPDLNRKDDLHFKGHIEYIGGCIDAIKKPFMSLCDCHSYNLPGLHH